MLIKYPFLLYTQLFRWGITEIVPRSFNAVWLLLRFIVRIPQKCHCPSFYSLVQYKSSNQSNKISALPAHLSLKLLIKKLPTPRKVDSHLKVLASRKPFTTRKSSTPKKSKLHVSNMIQYNGNDGNTFQNI